MLQPFILAIGLIPIIFRLGPLLLPATWLESYGYWSSETLNRLDGQGEPTTFWRNQGYWRDTDVYPEAARALATGLLEFADAKPGGSVLDLAHGSGESLSLHLSQTPPPSSLTALTSLKSETLQAQGLISERHPDLGHLVTWQTNSASFHPSSTSPRNLAHPLNPMKGYMGSPASPGHIYEDDGGDYEEDSEQEGQDQHVKPSGGFDLIYVLDSIYHFPPAVPHFLTTAIQSLSPGGVIAYTDIIPPPDLPSWLGYWILPTALGVPTRNLMARPKDLAAYKAQLEKIGYVDVRIDDWTEDVWPGFAKFLREKGGLWTLVARGAEWGLRNDWKFIAVRAAKKD